ncbi:MAG TPA: sulfatase-like hydrolase/transferase [Opitutaceae bacterium]|jgi:arylsulfatase A-like enzyme
MRPNILLILATQWRAQACGYAGDPAARTPFLDALSLAAVNFRQAVTPHPFGPFARAALLTGVESPANGVRDYFDALPADARTVAHAVRERSYRTFFFGKWHLFERDPDAALTGDDHARIVIPPGRRGGFDFFEGFESGFLLNDPWLHGTRLPEPVRFPGYQSDVLCARAAGLLGREKGPWFAVVSLEAPHPPYREPAPGVARRDAASVPLRRNVPPAAAQRAGRDLAGYYAHVEATDRAIGRLVAALPHDTAVILTSVHGDMHGSHGLFRKGWPHEESVRVPLLVAGLGRRGADDSAVSLSDIPGLVGALADGVPWAAPRPHARISMPSVVALPDQCDRAWAGVRTRDRKLVLGPDGVPWLHFDLSEDPLEERNLAGDPSRAAEAAELAALVSPR